MSLISIPSYIHLITCHGRQGTFPHGWGQTQVTGLFAVVNRIWRQANIQFAPSSPTSSTIQFPTTIRVDKIDNQGMVHLATQLRSRSRPGCTICCIHEFERGTRAAAAARELSFCAVQRISSVTDAAGRILAHELGHLLLLSHPEPPRNGPRAIDAMVAYGRNLMQAGVIQPNPLLTDQQRSDARSSAIASRFGRP